MNASEADRTGRPDRRASGPSRRLVHLNARACDGLLIQTDECTITIQNHPSQERVDIVITEAPTQRQAPPVFMHGQEFPSLFGHPGQYVISVWRS